MFLVSAFFLTCSSSHPFLCQIGQMSDAKVLTSICALQIRPKKRQVSVQGSFSVVLMPSRKLLCAFVLRV